jgi:hypothetical protein
MRAALPVVLIADAAILFLLGAVLILAPRQAGLAFQFRDLPPAVDFLIAMWGAALVSMAPGYLVAAQDPLRHVAWIQVGIARGALECLLGLVFLVRGLVGFPQAGFGIVTGAVVALVYVALYPRGEPSAAGTEASDR